MVPGEMPLRPEAGAKVPPVQGGLAAGRSRVGTITVAQEEEFG